MATGRCARWRGTVRFDGMHVGRRCGLPLPSLSELNAMAVTSRVRRQCLACRFAYERDYQRGRLDVRGWTLGSVMHEWSCLPLTCEWIRRWGTGSVNRNPLRPFAVTETVPWARGANHHEPHSGPPVHPRGIEGGEGVLAVKVQQCVLVAPAVDPLGDNRVGQTMIVQRALAFSSIHHGGWAGEVVLKIKRRELDDHGSSSPCWRSFMEGE